MRGPSIYKNGNYRVMIFPDGTKVRTTDDDNFVPEFAENCDVKITDYCDGGCPFCYEGCTTNGRHADFTIYENLINSLHPYTELALNGNDLSHPDLESLLLKLKDKSIYSNITVNQKHFMKNLDLLHRWTDEKLIYGLGVSLDNPTEEFIKEIQKFPNAVIHIIVGIFNNDDYKKLRKNNLKILVLGYKTLKRGVSFEKKNRAEIKENQEWLKKTLEDIKFVFSDKEDDFKVISFDNLAIEQLDVKSLISEFDWDSFYMGNDGEFTFYIDLVSGQFAKDSLSTERFPIEDKTIDEMFNFIRNKYASEL